MRSHDSHSLVQAERNICREPLSISKGPRRCLTKTFEKKTFDKNQRGDHVLQNKLLKIQRSTRRGLLIFARALVDECSPKTFQNDIRNEEKNESEDQRNAWGMYNIRMCDGQATPATLKCLAIGVHNAHTLVYFEYWLDTHTPIVSQSMASSQWFRFSAPRWLLLSDDVHRRLVSPLGLVRVVGTCCVRASFESPRLAHT